MNKVVKKLKYATIVVSSAIFGLYASNGVNSGMKNAKLQVKNDFQNLVLCREEKYVSYFNDEYGETSDSFFLRKRSVIKLDLAYIHDLENIKFFKNLKSIEISNAQLLNDHWINLLNESNIYDINLKFSSRGMIKNINNKFDFNKFTDKSRIKSVVLQDCDVITDYYGILMLNYFQNYDDIECLDLSQYKELDKKLDIIITHLNINENDDNIMRLMKGAKYIHDHLEYDPFVSQINIYKNTLSSLTDEQIEYYENNKTKKREASAYYNLYPLEAVLDDIFGVEKGICISYATLYSSLSLKMGVPLFYVGGGGHAWNMYADVNINQVPCYIDLTLLDKNEDLFKKVNNFFKYPSTNYRSEVINEAFIPVNSINAMQMYNLDGNIKDYYKDMPARTDTIFGTDCEMNYKTLILLSMLTGFQIELITLLLKLCLKNEKLKEKITNFFFEKIDDVKVNKKCYHKC